MSATLAAPLNSPDSSAPVSISALVRWLCFAVMMVGAFSAPTDIADGPEEDARRIAKGPIMLLKLANASAAGVIGMWGLVHLQRAREFLLSLPGLALCMIALLFLLTCVTSIKISASLPIAMVFIAYLIFMPTALAALDMRGTLLATLAGCLLFTLCALFLYFFVPRIGVFLEDLNDGIIIERLGGMSQPNHVGRTAMIGVLLTAYFFRIGMLPRVVLAGLFCVFVLAGVLSMSRTALLGVMICLVLLNLDLLFTRIGLTLTWLGVVTGLAGIVLLLATGREDALAKKLLGAVTKTGDMQEVTQVTGRYEIWERAVQLIKGRPLQGYGLGSNKEMLKEHLQSTHNILLHPTLAAGIGAGGLTLVLLLWNLINVLTYPQLIVRALSAYIIISGLTEDTIYETFPGACTLLWMVCCMWPAVVVGVQPVAPEVAEQPVR